MNQRSKAQADAAIRQHAECHYWARACGYLPIPEEVRAIEAAIERTRERDARALARVAGAPVCDDETEWRGAGLDPWEDE